MDSTVGVVSDMGEGARDPSGLWVIEANDLDVALKLAAAGSKACNRRVEVRPFL